MKFKMSMVPLLPGTLLLVIGSVALLQGSAGEAFPVLTVGLLLLILGVLMDIRSELERR